MVALLVDTSFRDKNSMHRPWNCSFSRTTSTWLLSIFDGVFFESCCQLLRWYHWGKYVLAQEIIQTETVKDLFSLINHDGSLLTPRVSIIFIPEIRVKSQESLSVLAIHTLKLLSDDSLFCDRWAFSSTDVWARSVLEPLVSRKSGRRAMDLLRSLERNIIGIRNLGGGFKYFLFPPQTLGKWSNWTCAYFSNGLKLDHQAEILRASRQWHPVSRNKAWPYFSGIKKTPSSPNNPKK